MFKLFGPVYGWWLFAFKWFNGILEKVNTNGQDGGCMELTLLRNWVQNHLLYELTYSLPDSAHPSERQMLERLIWDEGKRGGMATQIAIYQSENSADGVRLPKKKLKFINLRTEVEPIGMACYLFLRYAQACWPDIKFIDELSMANGTGFLSKQSTSCVTYIHKNGICYGCLANKWTQADCYTLVQSNDSSVFPVEINSLFVLRVPRKLPHACAIVHRLKSDEELPQFPWDLHANVLGIHISYAESYGDYEVIPASSIQCPLALIPVYSNVIQCELWIFDYDATNNKIYFDDDDDDNNN
ncbi:hypothetical protein VKT23_011893 [Stygiomarasmius scandens]|uniref:Uncharacterized protein n=1 Tax=Marasmiellus scandens TaxID=2682957 RepID=A0ABR1JCS0_9AGAR